MSPKKITAQAHLGDAGVALIHLRVSGMGHIWHERKTDAGIDGEIELRDSETNEVRNHIVFVQSKASELPFPHEDETSFRFTVRENDLAYWLGGNVPVVLVCSHPSRGEAWWVHVNEYFGDAARRESRVVVFDKASQAFDASASVALARIAAPIGSGIYLGHEPRTETILSNLLPVRHPETVYWAPTEATEIKTLGEALRESGTYRRDWVLRGGHLYSFEPFKERGWNQWLAGPEMTHPTGAWLSGDDDAERAVAVELLNRTLRDAHHRDLAWHAGKRLLYFRATPDLTPRHEVGRGTRDRTVFKAHMKKRDKTQVAYYRHDAVRLSWIVDDDRWLAQLIPTYHFTRDGREDYPWADEQLSGIKRFEHAFAVESSVRMWASFLRGDRPRLGAPGSLLEFDELLTFEATQGIDDSGWDAASSSPASDADGSIAVEVADGVDNDDDPDEQGALW